MKVRKRKGMLVIVVPLLDSPKKSKSGKRLLVASSRGARRTAVKVNGQHVVVNFNAYIRPNGYVKGAGIPQRRNVAILRRISQKRGQVKRAVPAKHRSR